MDILDTTIKTIKRLGGREESASSSDISFENRFTDLEHLADGGISQVFLAFDKCLNRRVALKTIRFNQPDIETDILWNDAKAAGGLDHPNIVPVYDMQFSEGKFYYVMKYIEGISLWELIAQVKAGERELSFDDAMSIFEQILNALEYAHEQKVLHLDLKPENIMIDDKLHATVIDWGASIFEAPQAESDSDKEKSSSDHIIGTKNYMPPEQEVGEPADVYALGAVLFSLLTLSRPSRKAKIDLFNNDWKGSTRFDKHRQKACLEKMTGAQQTRAIALIKESMAFEIDQRTASVRNMRKGLAGLPFNSKSKRSGSRRGKAILIAVLLAVVTLSAGIVYLQQEEVHRAKRNAASLNLKFKNLSQSSFETQAESQAVTIINANIKNLELLRGMELRRLNARSTMIKNLDPLKDMPLEYLNLRKTLVSDLKPISRLKLHTLILSFSAVTQLNDIKGMPLDHLDIEGTQVTSLESLRGMPLKILDLEGCPVSDLSPLSDMPLDLLDIEKTHVRDISALRGMQIKRLDLEFLKLDDISPLKGMPLMELDIEGTQVEDLSAVKGMPLTFLDVEGTRVKDLSAIRGMQSLKELRMGNTAIRSLEPLRGLKLEELRCENVEIEDWSPISRLPLILIYFGNTEITPGMVRLLRNIKTLKIINNKDAKAFLAKG